MNKENYIIEILNLNKSYNLKNKTSIEIIKNLNFSLKPNTKISIIV